MVTKKKVVKKSKSKKLKTTPRPIGLYGGGRSQFERPGSNSALRKATKWNPRRHPCPTCGTPNCLTDQDKAHGYQCDRCADRAEGLY